ncbi:hypothetical protein ABZ990_15090 [Streptomyces sp. NPDC046203]|uniref:hypothetical protein n=1 Tax=Streptomyces sp. NPDC046203 TaxID=3154602 RepID=UPI0033F906BC
MASHTPLRTITLRAATVVCAVLVSGAVPATLAHAQAAAVAEVPSPTPRPYSNLTPAQIADKGIAATKTATSFRMSGHVMANGRAADVDISLNQSDCAGTVKLRGGSGEVRQVGGTTYIMGDDGFWRASMAGQKMSQTQINEAVTKLHGHWLRIPAGMKDSRGMKMEQCNVKSIAAGIGKFSTMHGQIVRGPDATVNNTPVATVIKRNNVSAHGRTHEETSTLSVAAHGTPYVLKAVRTGGGNSGTLTFSDFNKTVKVTAPPANQTVDVSSMKMMSPSPSPS